MADSKENYLLDIGSERVKGVTLLLSIRVLIP